MGKTTESEHKKAGSKIGGLKGFGSSATASILKQMENKKIQEEKQQEIAQKEKSKEHADEGA